MEQQCPLCSKLCKGKIGAGVHLKRSHTTEERSKLYMDQATAIIPIMLAWFLIVGALRYLTAKPKQEVT